MSRKAVGTWLCDSRGNPSRWIALALTFMFGLGTLGAALFGAGHGVTAVLAGVFVVCFNEAFGRRSLIDQVASCLARSRGPAGGGRPKAPPFT